MRIWRLKGLKKEDLFDIELVVRYRVAALPAVGLVWLGGGFDQLTNGRQKVSVYTVHDRE